MLQKTTLLLLISTAVGLGATGLTSAQEQSQRGRGPAPDPSANVDKFHNFTAPVKTENQQDRAQATASDETRGTRSERRRGREANMTHTRRDASGEIRTSDRSRMRAEERRPSAERVPAAGQSMVGVDTVHGFAPPAKTEETTAELRGTRSERRRGREVVRARGGESEYVRSAVGTPSTGTTSSSGAAPNTGYNNYSYNNGSWNSGSSRNNSWDWGSSPRYSPGYSPAYSSWDNSYSNRCYTMGRVLIDGAWQTRRVWICG